MLPPVFEPSGYHANGQQGKPFDFSQKMRQLCADVVSRCEPFHYIDLKRILFGVTQARLARHDGLQAKIIPMRFHDGALTRQRRGKVYQVQRFWVDGVEILYLINFCLPRYLDQSFDSKFITLFHELYHIAPAFNGDLRRHGGRYSIHTRSQKDYDHQMAALARKYLSAGADPALHSFLRLNFGQLQASHGSVVGMMVPMPKLVWVQSASPQG
jgi:predicted metallopeptidase